MAINFTTSNPSQIESVAHLLQQAFHSPSDSSSLDHSYLDWKYHMDGPAWPGSRSYILAEGSAIIAHAVIWPIQLRVGNELRQGISFGDWAADGQHRGAGLFLLRRLMTLSSFVMVTGGAEITRAILPRAGFEQWSERQVYARVLRPIRQMLTRGKTLGWKEPLRLARNFNWSLAPLAPLRSWTADPSSPDDQLLNAAQAQPGSIHTPEYLRYILRCPTVDFRYFALSANGCPQGFSVVALVGGQARIAELRITSVAQDDWNSAISAVIHATLKLPGICEIIAFGSAVHLNRALEANGFQKRGRLPVNLFDPSGTMAQQPFPQLGMLEDDAAVLNDPDSPYKT